MTPDTSKNEVPQPEHSTSTSSDSNTTAKNSLASNSKGLSKDSLNHYANGVCLKSSQVETPEERGKRLENSRQLESQRLKGRLSQIPWHAKRAEAEGENYWLELAASYQGN